MKRDDPPPRFGPVQVRRLEARLSLFTGNDGSIVLPDLILWSFELNEGDLLTVDKEEPNRVEVAGEMVAVEGPDLFYVESYGRFVKALGDWEPMAAWPFIEEKLSQPMAALGSEGRLLLPKEAAGLAQPETKLLLSMLTGEGFMLRLAEGEPISANLFLEVSYRLPLEAGGQVRLPEDLLWVSGLEEGDELVWKVTPGQADCEPLGHSFATNPQAPVVKLGPGGALPMPEKFLRDLAPGWEIVLIATFKPQPVLRFTYDVGGMVEE